MDNFAPIAPPVAHIGSLEVVALDAKAKDKRNRRRRKVAYSRLFEGFWSDFPVHRDKAKAQVAFDDAVAAGYDVAAIIAGAQRYARWLKTSTTAPKYAQGWLNDRRWEDELDIPFEVGATDPAFIVGTPEWDARVQAEEDRAIEEISYEL